MTTFTTALTAVAAIAAGTAALWPNEDGPFKADTSMECPPGAPNDDTPCTEDAWYCEECMEKFNDKPVIYRAWEYFKHLELADKIVLFGVFWFTFCGTLMLTR